MSKNPAKKFWTFTILAILGLALVVVLAYQVPSIKSRLSWRVDIAKTYLRGIINPVQPFPTPAETVVAPPPGPYPNTH
jgi:hypothetical protein